MFSLDRIRSVNDHEGDDSFGKIMYDLRMKWCQETQCKDECNSA